MTEAITRKDFERILREIIADMTPFDILVVPGATELFGEHMRDQVVDQWNEERHLEAEMVGTQDDRLAYDIPENLTKCNKNAWNQAIKLLGMSSVKIRWHTTDDNGTLRNVCSVGDSEVAVLTCLSGCPDAFAYYIDVDFLIDEPTEHYDGLDTEEFNRIFDELVSKMEIAELLAIEGVEELVLEHLNNDVLDQWIEERRELGETHYGYWVRNEPGVFAIFSTRGGERVHVGNMYLPEDGNMDRDPPEAEYFHLNYFSKDDRPGNKNPPDDEYIHRNHSGAANFPDEHQQSDMLAWGEAFLLWDHREEEGIFGDFVVTVPPSL